MHVRKFVRTFLWLSILVDAFIVTSLTLKVYRGGLRGLSAWFRHVHAVAWSATDGQVTFRLEPDYRFTVLYVGTILGAFALTFALLRLYLKSRDGAHSTGSGYHYDASHA